MLVVYHNNLLFLHRPLKFQCVSYNHFLSGFKIGTFSRSDVRQFVIQVSGCTCKNKIQQESSSCVNTRGIPPAPLLAFQGSFRGVPLFQMGGVTPILATVGIPILAGGGGWVPQSLLGGGYPRCHPGVPPRGDLGPEIGVPVPRKGPGTPQLTK